MPSVSTLFHTPQRFLRSAHLERDFRDADALSTYVLTGSVQAVLERIGDGLRPDSGQRAWRVTADYGTGKSSFALCLAQSLSLRGGRAPSVLRDAQRLLGPELPKLAMVPVLVTGSRADLGSALLTALTAAAKRASDTATGSAKARLKKVLASCETSTPAEVCEALATTIVDERLGGGLVVIIDELGKFLEFAAMRPDASDVFLLQELAETAARSGAKPMLVLTLLHQGFHEYAAPLSRTTQAEWEKVAGRYSEVVFDQPLAHSAQLATQAMGIREDQLPQAVGKKWRRLAEQVAALGWFGRREERDIVGANAARLFPLHPAVLPVAVQLFRRFGQNERSLFALLLGHEPGSVQTFAEDHQIGTDASFELAELYDYSRVSLGDHGRSGVTSWARVAAIIEAAHDLDDADLRVLKTVGLLNLVEAESLRPTADALQASCSTLSGEDIDAAVSRLRKRGLLFEAGGGGLRLWSHASVDLERALRDARRALPTLPRVSSFIGTYVTSRPVTARRHQVETGTLRQFVVRLVPPDVRTTSTFMAEPGDGEILVLLSDTPSDHKDALDFAKAPAAEKHPATLIVVPPPLAALGSLVDDARAWDWVAANTPALSHDPFGAEEVGRQIRKSRQMIEVALEDYLGLEGGRAHELGVRWFASRRQLQLRTRRSLLVALSEICDRVYDRAPRIRNELVNRRALSSAAAKARMLLIGRIFDHAAQPLLGMDEAKAPPEKSIYLSVLQNSGLHRKGARGVYAISLPSERADICALTPTFACLEGLLTAQPDVRVSAEDALACLRRPPYGVRDGVGLLLLACFAKANEHHLAFYENGAFLPRMDGAAFLRLSKVPHTFELQLCRVKGVRAEMFARVAALVLVSKEEQRDAELLDVVTALCSFAARLPEQVRKTHRLSATARAVRQALLDAQEPVRVLFRELPTACGLEPILPNTKASTRVVDTFVERLRVAIEELRSAYSQLLSRLHAAVEVAFVSADTTAGPAGLRTRAAQLMPSLREPQLRAFVGRLADVALPSEQWVEALATVVVSKPPARWSDSDEEMFADELTRLAKTFQRVESMAFERKVDQDAVRIVLTRPDGTELDRVVHLTNGNESAVAATERAISKLMAASPSVGLVAVSRAFMRAISDRHPDEEAVP